MSPHDISPVTLLHRLSTSIVYGVSVACAAIMYVMPPSILRAAEPGGSGRTTPPDPEGTSSMSGVTMQHLDWWVYASGLLLGALMFVGYMLYRMYEEDQAPEWHKDTMPIRPPSEAAADELSPESEEWVRTDASDRALYSVEAIESHDLDTSSEWGDERQNSSTDRVCPECGGQFAAPMLVCPEDATPLQEISVPEAQPTIEDSEALERKRCPGCERRYSSETTYCYRDGIRLVSDTLEHAEEAPVYQVCETCGYETDDDERLCPRDGSELLTVVPEGAPPSPPTVPYAMCPECGDKAPPGETHCPEDGHVLTPICHAHAEQFSSTGFGPPRKICRECGETYTGAATYCSADGHELMSIN